ncbi:Tetratricopeptide repeat protein 25 [Chytridiales sp. JEL 0842]|nr:Tetratricopeptide repeat protein 25 [Chytridiales sp. JEL 0842]
MPPATKPTSSEPDSKKTETMHTMDGEEGDGPVTSFQSYAAEGDILAKQGDYRKSIEAYTKALNMRPLEKHVLVARSKCYLQLGDSQAALEDANMALKEDKDFFKGVFQKAEALYAKGDFEMALVFYHRGNKLRPELDEFRLGIQKAREAIDNSIGNPKDYKFQPPSGVRFLGGSGPTATTGAVQGKQGGSEPTKGNRDSTKKDSAKTVKQLLGELYADKEYLESLVNDKDFISNPNHDIYSLVTDALNYLETRTEFWRQQKPIYARRKEHSKILAKAISARNRQLIAARAKQHQDRELKNAQTLKNPKAAGGLPSRPHTTDPSANGNGSGGVVIPTQNPPQSESVLKSINASMNVIHRSIQKGDYTTALSSAKSLLGRLDGMKGLSDKGRVVSDVNAVLGGVYLEVGNLSGAVGVWRKDLELVRAGGLEDCVSRALGNLGRAFVKLGKFEEAMKHFKEKLSIASTTPLEKAWLLHDIGRCHLELGKYEEAKQFGEECAKVAEGLGDARWGLNAGVLVGQAELRLGNPEASSKAYTLALRHAETLQDSKAVDAISKALSEVTGGHHAHHHSHHQTKAQMLLASNPLAAKHTPATLAGKSSKKTLPAAGKAYTTTTTTAPEKQQQQQPPAQQQQRPTSAAPTLERKSSTASAAPASAVLESQQSNSNVIPRPPSVKKPSSAEDERRGSVGGDSAGVRRSSTSAGKSAVAVV